MNSLGKRRIALTGGVMALLALIAFSDPIADIRVTHDATATTVGRVETNLNFGLVAFSFLHIWKRAID